MASVVTPGASTLALELGGQPATPLRKAAPPSYRVLRPQATDDPATWLGRSGVVTLGEMGAELTQLEPGPLLDWIGQLCNGQVARHSGALLQADHNGQLTRRIHFSDALLTELQLPKLSVRDGKLPFAVGLKWLPQRVLDDKASGKLVASLGNKRKQLLTANFRVQGLPFDSSGLTEASLPTVRARLDASQDRRPGRGGYAAVDAGELALTFSPRSRAAAMAWLQTLMADNQVDGSEVLDLSVELLDSALKKVMASITLSGCALLACEEAVLQNQAETLAGLTLRFLVGRVGVDVKG